jgi:hypothetical protein
MHGPNAASVAHHILDTFFAKKDGRPLPPPPTPADMRFDFSDPFGRPAPRAPQPAPDRTVAAATTTD